MMNALIVVLTLATATPAHADEMLMIDPISGEATFFTETALEAYLRDQGGNADGEQMHALSAEVPEISVSHPVTGETVPLADIDVASLSESDRRFLDDQLFFQRMQLDQVKQADPSIN